MMNKRKVVVVTGASAGVGREVARAFGRKGYQVALLSRGSRGLATAKREVERLGGKALAIPTDVSHADEVEEAARVTEEAFGPIDIWVNNAMVSVFSPVKDMTAEEYRRVMEVTFLGYVHGTLSALKRMLPRNRGKIVQVGSALAYRAIPLQSAYCAAKHAIEGFTESLRSELLHDRSQVFVTTVQLPAINTPHFGWVRSKLPRKPQPVAPIYSPKVAAEAIVWASRKRRREVWVGSSTALAIALNRLFPGLGDRYLARTGYESQQTDEPAEPNHQDNLWVPIEADRGAQGNFGLQAHKRSTQLQLTKWRNWIAGGVAAAAAVGFVFSTRPRDPKRLARKLAARRAA